MSAQTDPFAPLRARFIERARGDLTTFSAHLSGAAPLSDADLRLASHRLAGAAGTFGFHDLSIAAGRLEDAIITQEDPTAPLRSVIDALTQVISHPTATALGKVAPAR